MRERVWLALAESIVKLAARAQGRLAGKPPSIINDTRALAGRALAWIALYCLRQSEREANRNARARLACRLMLAAD